MPPNQTDPLSPQALTAGNTYSQAVKDRLAYLLGGFANGLLGANTGHDATAETQKGLADYNIQRQSNGLPPVTLAQFQQIKLQPPASAPQY